MSRVVAINSRRSAGFTLLEVMIAVAILAVSLMALSLTMIRSVRASQHARFMTQATFLCRLKFGELENNFVVDGFTDDAGVVEKKGEFEDPFKRFRWFYQIRKIELPSADKIQTAATKLIQDKQQIASAGTSDSAGARGGAGASGSSGLTGSMGPLLGPVKQMLEQGIRRVTVRVQWVEPGLPEQQVEAVTFFTDMRRIPLGSALTGGAGAPPTGTPGTTPATTPATGTPSTGVVR